MYRNFFLYFGSVLCNYKENVSKTSLLFLSPALLLVTSLANKRASMYLLIYNNYLLYILAAVFGAVFVLCLAFQIKRHTTLISRFLDFFGTEFIIALGTHQLILNLFPQHALYNWFLLVPLTAIVMKIYSTIREKLKYFTDRINYADSPRPTP